MSCARTDINAVGACAKGGGLAQTGLNVAAINTRTVGPTFAVGSRLRGGERSPHSFNLMRQSKCTVLYCRSYGVQINMSARVRIMQSILIDPIFMVKVKEQRFTAANGLSSIMGMSWCLWHSKSVYSHTHGPWLVRCNYKRNKSHGEKDT